MSTTTQAKHTPGPWSYADDGMIYAEMEAAGKFFSVKVCDPHADNLDLDEREANAALIASAPQLLEALKALKAHIEDLTGTIGIPSFSPSARKIVERGSVVGEQVRAAIAAAEGR